MANEIKISYDKGEIRAITQSFKAMDDKAVKEAQETSFELADFLRGKIQQAAAGRTKAGKVAVRVAEGAKVSKTSKIGELSLGFASQKFSGGGSTRDLWGGIEFGSKKYKQFPIWSGRFGRGSRGYFIYPTLRANQAELVKKWEDSFADILKKWD